MGQRSLTTQKKINLKNELFRRKYTQEKAMYSSLLSFGQLKLKYITRTARYWYKSVIFHATNKQIFFIETPGVSLDQYVAPH